MRQAYSVLARSCRGTGVFRRHEQAKDGPARVPLRSDRRGHGQHHDVSCLTACKVQGLVSISNVSKPAAAAVSCCRRSMLQLPPGHIVHEAMRGRLAVVHINLAEGGSVYRKAALLALLKLVGRAGPCCTFTPLGSVNFTSWSIGGEIYLSDGCSMRPIILSCLGMSGGSWVIETSGVSPNRSALSIMASLRRRCRRRAATARRAFRLLFVGNLSERKGVTDLLTAFAAPSLRHANCPSHAGRRWSSRDLPENCPESGNCRPGPVHRLG